MNSSFWVISASSRETSSLPSKSSPPVGIDPSNNHFRPKCGLHDIQGGDARTGAEAWALRKRFFGYIVTNPLTQISHSDPKTQF